MAKRSRSSAKDKNRVVTSEAKPFNTALAGLASLKASLGASDDDAKPPPPAAPPEEPLTESHGDSSAYVLKGKIALHREKKGRAGKTATRISGLQLEPEALSALAQDIKRQLGCGAVIEDEDLVLLGDLAERAADWLRANGAKRIV